MENRSSISRPSIASWMCRISGWRPFSLYCFQSIRETGWPPSISKRLTYRFQSIRNLAPSSALWHKAEFFSSQRCALNSPRPRRFSPGSWLLFPPFSILGVFACVDTSTTGLSSRPPESLLQDLQVVLDLCLELGIVINPEKSNLEPSQVVQYLGVIINAQTFVASPLPERISRLQSTAGEFLSSAAPPASIWLSLLGMLSSMSHLIPGGRIRMRSLQLCLHQSWDRVDQSTRIPWSPDCLRDLRWWLNLPCISQGVSLRQVSPDLDFWSDASAVGWGAHLGHHTTSGLWSEDEVPLSINAKELLAVRRLLHFQSSLVGKTIAVFCDNSMAVAYLRKEGGTRSPFLNSLAQGILCWSESLAIRLAPQYIPGSLNILVDSLVLPSPATSYRVVPQPGCISICVVVGQSKSTYLPPQRIATARSFSLPSGTL